MEASAAYLQLPCFLSGTPLRAGSTVKSTPGRLRTILATAEPSKPKGPDRRGAIASLAGLFAGASFMGVAEAAIDSSALLERYQAAKGSGSPTKSIVKAPVATPQTTPSVTTPAKTTKAASAGSKHLHINPVVLGAAALIAGGIALTGLSGQSTGKKSKARRSTLRSTPFARAPARGSRRAGASRVIGTRPLRRTPVRGATVVVSARPPAKKVPPKLASRKPPPKRVIPKPARKKVFPKPVTSSRAKKAASGKTDPEANTKLLGVLGFGLAIGAVLLVLNPSSGQKVSSKGAQSANIPKAAVANTTRPSPPARVASTAKVAPALAATSKPVPKKSTATKQKPVVKTKEATRAKEAVKALASRKTSLKTQLASKPVKRKPAKAVKPVKAVKPKPATKASLGVKAPKTVKRKRIVTRPAPRRKTQGVPASTFAFGIIVLAAVGSYFYLEGEGKSSSGRAAETRSTVAEPVVQPPASVGEESSPSDESNDGSKKGLFGFGKN